ncbi:MAG: DUF1552 domain-containing protein [Acidobacteria bacterium]|nr:DUF1552 domain-containing protein [Acidobacteriota bacterium]
MRRSLPRRTLLRAAGVALALPKLDCFAQAAAVPRRMIILANNLGVLPKHFFPATAGRDYEVTPYLQHLQPHRKEFTVFSGLSHPGVSGGHSADNCLLTAARGAFKSGFRNSISFDQFVAEKLGQVTRFPSINLGINIDKGNRSLSWTRDGVLLPAEDNAAKLYERLFVQGDQQSVERQIHRLETRGSILDALRDETRRFAGELGADDKARLDQYVTSVREVEQRLETAKAWESKPKPSVNQPPPSDISEKRLFFEKLELMLAMAQLAIETDSTRIVTIMADAFVTPVLQIAGQKNSTESYHGLSHHGQNESKVLQLEEIDHRQMRIFANTISSLAGKREDGDRLLDRTMLFYGSNMGDANIHDNTNLPILLAGGGFPHGRHMVFRRDNNTPLCNLFISMMQRMGVDGERFASGTGALAGLG